jgi:hypothetical protein
MAQDGVALVEVQPRRTAVIAATVDMAEFPRVWGSLLGEVYAFVRECPEFTAAFAGVPGPHWQNVMLYRDHAPNVEVGVLAPCPFTPQGRVTESQLPGGRAATTVHPRDPRQIGSAHDAVRAYLNSHQLRPSGVIWEIYGHPADDGSLDTEVFHLLA